MCFGNTRLLLFKEIERKVLESYFRILFDLCPLDPIDLRLGLWYTVWESNFGSFGPIGLLQVFLFLKVMFQKALAVHSALFHS